MVPRNTLPEIVEDALLRVIDGPDADLAAGVAALCSRWPDWASAIRAEAAALQRSADLDETSSPHGAPVIAGFRVLAEIGEGGMGSVYLAEQRSPVRRRVALKVIKPGMDTRAVLARFEVERQALALMEHPNIARVSEAGATSGGRPYFAMEHVKGMAITRYCDEHKLTVDERLTLFRQVCAAVQHAHQKGVIHRDLTPNNVLVTIVDGKATAKIIDFGLARATDHKLTEKTVFTEQGVILGTPEYMSPEQAGLDALDIDARSDVYSLGVLLYELLTGAPPFSRQQLRAAGYDRMCQIIRTEEPERPSTRITQTHDGTRALARLRRTDPDRLLRRLRGDLDWIVLKCLEKDRTRRYESASELGADILRHVECEPVLARAPSLGYRLSKLAMRHRREVIGVAAVVLALVAGTVAATYFAFDAIAQAGQASEQRREADRQRERALAFAREADAERGQSNVRAGEAVAALLRSDGFRMLAESRLRLREDPEVALLLAWEAGEQIGMPAVYRDLVDAGAASLFHCVLSDESKPVREMEFDATGEVLMALRRGGDGPPVVELFSMRQQARLFRVTLPLDTERVLPMASPARVLSFHADGRILAWAVGGRSHEWARFPPTLMPPWQRPFFGAPRVTEDGTRAAVGTADGRVVRLDLQLGLVEGVDSLMRSGPVDWLRADPVAVVIDWQDARVIASVRDREGWTTVAISRDGEPRHLAASSERPTQALAVNGGCLLSDGEMVRVCPTDGGRPLVRWLGSGSILLAPDLSAAVEGPKRWDLDVYGNMNEDAFALDLFDLWADEIVRPLPDDSASSSTVPRVDLRRRASLGPHQWAVDHVEFSRDRKSVLTSDEAGWRLWSAADGASLAQGAECGGARLCPDGDWVASGVGDSVVRLWHLRAPQATLRFPPCANDLRDVALSADGRLLGAAGAYGDGFLLDRTTGRELVPRGRVGDWSGGGTWPGVAKGYALLEFHGSGDRLALSYIDPNNTRCTEVYGTQRQWQGSVPDLPDRGNWFGHGIRFSPSVDRVLAARLPDMAVLVDPGSGAIVRDLRDQGEITALAPMLDLERISIGLADGTLLVVDGRNGTTLARTRMPAPARRVVCDDAGELFVVHGEDEVLRTFRLVSPSALAVTGEYRLDLQVLRNDSGNLPESEYLTVTACGSIAIFSGESVRRLGIDLTRGGREVALPVAGLEVPWSHLATPCDAYVLPQRPGASGLRVARTLDRFFGINGLGDGGRAPAALRRFGTEEVGGEVLLVDLETGVPVVALPGELAGIDPGGGFLITQRADRLDVLRAGVGGCEVAFTLDGSAGSIAAFTPRVGSGRFAIALGSGVVVVVDLGRGQELFRFQAHADWIGALELDAAGTLLATVSTDNTARLWPLEPKRFFADAVERARSDPAVRERFNRARDH